MKKITFIGDIMIEPPVLKAAKRKGGTYDFSGVFQYVQPLLDEADFVVGNLETPMAGKEATYTQHHYAFNAPDEYADAVKNAGFDLISTANNHTFDRGYEGMIRTIKVLDEKGINHAGSYLPGAERPEAFYADIGDTKVAFVVYTYGTNYGGSGGKCLAEGEYEDTVNLLRHQSVSSYLPGVLHEKDWVDKVFKKKNAEARGRIKKRLGMCHTYARADDRVDPEAIEPYMQKMQADIRKAKEKADLVIFYPHAGGQFNLKPGYFTQYVVKKALEAGADAIAASHSHCPQIIRQLDGIPVAYSLGNFNMDPLSSLALHEHLSEYGLALHLYIENKKIQKVTFSMLKNYGKKRTQVAGYPVDQLHAALPEGKEKTQLEKDVRKLYGTVTGRVMKADEPLIRREYELF